MGGETRNPQLRQDYRIISSMSQNCLKFWDKFETKLRTDLRPYRDNFETYLTILLLRANWEIFETWVHSVLLYLFFNFEKFGIKSGFLFTQLNQAAYSKLGGKSNFDMFYKKDCWAVICYPICMNNVPYKRGIIVLSFPIITFVILIFCSSEIWN